MEKRQLNGCLSVCLSVYGAVQILCFLIDIADSDVLRL